MNKSRAVVETEPMAYIPTCSCSLPRTSPRSEDASLAKMTTEQALVIPCPKPAAGSCHLGHTGREDLVTSHCVSDPVLDLSPGLG